MTEPKESERRTSVRIHRHQHATLCRADTGDVINAVQVMNISDGGARLISAMPFDVGEGVILAEGGKKTDCVVLESKKLFNGFSVRVRFANA